MAAKTYIAERKLRAVDKQGVPIAITIGVGAPFLRENMDAWDCPVTVDGLYKNLSNSTGSDSWQALQLARNLVVHLLTSFIENGGKLYYFDDDEEIKLDDIHDFF